jgi:ubiquinone/menaquinone biosynthesis C-methylase UbiE
MKSGPHPILASLLGKFFNLLYHQLSWIYDFVSTTVSVGMWTDWVFTIIPYLSKQRILELGHGTGHLQKVLLHKKKQIVGIDLSPQMGRICVKKLKNQNLQPKLVNGIAQQLPFPKTSFEQVVSTFPTPFVLAPETIKEVHRVLIPGGEFFIIPEARITGGNIVHKVASWLFKVTGQTSELFETVYEQALISNNRFDFITSSEIIHLENSKILILRFLKAER